MLKINCPDCEKPFIWTDDMPLKGNCPNPDCEGIYNVHQSLKQSVSGRTAIASKTCHCPACGGAIAFRWTLCGHCGRIVAGSRTFRKRDLLFAVVLFLLVLSLLIRYGLKT
jgi:predicted nucleic acid-binding Zn ribbon protein